MIYNPLRVPLFDAAVFRVAVIIGALFVLALWERYHYRRSGDRSGMLIKVLTVTWLAPVLLISLFCGGLVLLLVAMLIQITALLEYINLLKLRLPYGVILIAFSVATAGLAALGVNYSAFLISALALFFTVVGVPIVTGRAVDSQRQVGAVMIGFFYITAGVGSIIYIRRVETWGLAFLVVVGTAVALCDAGGSVVGSRLRGPKLAPNVSPNKTWSGVFGGLLGAACGMAFQWPFLLSHWSWLFLLAAVPVTAFGAVWGDLAESAMKRDSGVKDAGRALKGFGGVLDRFDSFLVAIPLTFLLALALS